VIADGTVNPGAAAAIDPVDNPIIKMIGLNHFI
jgi:hypothetical protein